MRSIQKEIPKLIIIGGIKQLKKGKTKKVEINRTITYSMGEKESRKHFFQEL